MKTEQVNNITIYQTEKELERLYTLLEKHDCNIGKPDRNHHKDKLFTDDQVRIYLFKNVFKVKMTVLLFENFVRTLHYCNLVRFSPSYRALPRHSPPYPVVHTNHFTNFAF